MTKLSTLEIGAVGVGTGAANTEANTATIEVGGTAAFAAVSGLALVGVTTTASATEGSAAAYLELSVNGTTFLVALYTD